jgi:long-subunit fatty acid transport protein
MVGAAMRRATLVFAAVVASILAPRIALASTAQEFPDNGSEQMGRGGAWVARASDPLAAFYNPAGLAGQRTALTLQANVAVQSTCFSRIKAMGDTTADGTPAGTGYGKVCNDAAPFPAPVIGFTYRLNDRIGLGLLILGPSGVGATTWPEFGANATPSPQRYLLISSNALLLMPTLGIGAEIIDRLRIGASFQFGTAPNIDFVNTAAAANVDNANPSMNDVRNELFAQQVFIPGFTLGTIWSPTDELDVAGWYKWSAGIDTTGDVQTQFPYFNQAVAGGDHSGVQYGDTSVPNCNQAMQAGGMPPPNTCGSGNNAHIKVPIPMEAKIGVRYHRRLADAPAELHKRDPLAQDRWDVEADLTWANDSAFDNLQLRFPSNAMGDGTLPANPAVLGGTIPPNADIRHHWKDVVGVRVGGDYSILPQRLAVRAGAFFETAAADKVYQNLDFIASQRIGLTLGGTFRIPIGTSGSLDLMAGYGHIFYGNLDNSDPNAQGLSGLAGTPCNGGTDMAGNTCSNGATKYRTNWPVNLGTITNSVDILNVGASYRF